MPADDTCVVQHVPYITLRLSGSSSSEQLQQWHHATRKLQHVRSIHIRIVGEVPSEAFELAMQLLSQSYNSINELVAVCTPDCGKSYNSSRGRLITLQPVKHIVSKLETLLIKGIAVVSLADDLQALAAAAEEEESWQL